MRLRTQVLSLGALERRNTPGTLCATQHNGRVILAKHSNATQDYPKLLKVKRAEAVVVTRRSGAAGAFSCEAVGSSRP